MTFPDGACEVLAANETSGSGAAELPATGAGDGALTLVGLGLLVVGSTLLVLIADRRRQAPGPR
ncbi:MAG TPA: LPXTG cell wall anchor domain-containing protein [Acidimicrobiales bacterium]